MIQITALLIKIVCTNSYVDDFILVCVDLSKRKVDLAVASHKPFGVHIVHLSIVLHE